MTTILMMMVGTLIFDMDRIPLFYNAMLLQMGFKYPIYWQPNIHPHFLIVGATGSGKTYAIKLLMAKISKYFKLAKIFICDYKNSDFLEFSDCKNYYAYEDCALGLQIFYDKFSARLNGDDKNLTPLILIFDEWGAFISSKDKKNAEDVKAKLATMLMLGRTLQVFISIGIQRADSENFKSGARDQFSAILGLGNLSKEQKQMLFSDYKDVMTNIDSIGQGYLSLDGKGIIKVQVPKINDFKKLSRYIRATLE